MKTIILTLTLALSTFFTKAQSSNWVWAKCIGGTNGDMGQSIVVDSSGSIYVTGIFSGSSITFDSITLTNNNASFGDIFIVKYAPSGSVLWAKSVGGTDIRVSNSITVDGSGNTYVTGYFNSSITLGTTTLTSNGDSDFFIAKFDPSGNVLWAKRAGGTSSDAGASVVVDGSGNSFVTGSFISGSITFGTTTLVNSNNNNSFDIFIVKYDPSGNVLWAKSAGGTTDDSGISISVDGSGNSYVTGSFASDSVTFGTATLVNSNNNYSFDIFIVKYDPSGNVLWAKSAGGSSSNQGRSIVVDGSGNSYVIGTFYGGSLTFGSSTLFTTNGTHDIFLAKYDPSGNALWANSAVGMSDDFGASIAVDGSSNLYITGFFHSSNITFGSTTLTNNGSSDICVVKYGPSGNVLWAKSAGGTNTDEGKSITVDGSGNLYVTGGFSSSSLTFGTTTLTNNGLIDIFVAKLGNSTTGLSNISLTDAITIFPNPFSSHTILQLDKNVSNATLTVENIFGQTVTEINNISGQRLTLQRNNLPAGVYFIRLKEDHKQIATKKILIID